MSKQEVILCEELESSLTSAIGKCPHDKLFILTDEHTHRLCLPQLNGIPALKEATEIIIGAEDVHKNLETLASVWQALSEQGHPPFTAHQPGRRHGDRPGWFCRLHFQEGYCLHQYSHYAAGNGGRFRGRQNGHQLQRTEE